MDNPYQTPRETGGARSSGHPEPLPVPLRAAYQVDAALRKQVVRFDIWRSRALRRLLFPLSLAALLTLLGGLVLQLPVPLIIVAGTLFAVTHTLQVLLPIAWTQLALRRIECGETDPCPAGRYEIEVTEQYLSCRIDSAPRAWTLSSLENVFYLGDMLIVVPQPQCLIPIPQRAECNTNSFGEFCQRFAALCQASPADEQMRDGPPGSRPATV